MGTHEQDQVGQDLIWNYYQTESLGAFEGSRARIGFLLRMIPASAKVLNIGCGSGLFEAGARQRGLDIYSLDPSADAIARLRDSLQLGEKAKVGHVQKIPFADSLFDVVVVSEVLEHLTPDVTAAGLVEIKRVLKPTGRIIGTVPSRENLAEQFVVCPCCGAQYHRWGHQQAFAPSDVHKLLSQHFLVSRVLARPFTPWATLTWKGRLLAAGKTVLWRLGSHGSNENIVFEARKPAPM